jgi:hypothetical protein
MEFDDHKYQKIKNYMNIPTTVIDDIDIPLATKFVKEFRTRICDEYGFDPLDLAYLYHTLVLRDVKAEDLIPGGKTQA